MVDILFVTLCLCMIVGPCDVAIMTTTNIAARRFSCCVSTVWNSLPSFVRTADSFTSFSSQLKNYMFARHL